MKKSFNTNHPELEDGEMFLTNEFILDYYRREYKNSIGYKTKRMGKYAYTVNGILISKYSKLYPIFVQIDEYDEVQNERKKFRF